MQQILKLATIFVKTADRTMPVIPVTSQAWKRIEAAVRTLLLSNFGNLYTKCSLSPLSSDPSTYTISGWITVPANEYSAVNEAMNDEIPGFINDAVRKQLHTNYAFDFTLAPDQAQTPKEDASEPTNGPGYQQQDAEIDRQIDDMYKNFTPEQKAAVTEIQNAVNRFGENSPEARAAEEKAKLLWPEGNEVLF